MHRPRSDFSVHFDFKSTYQIRAEKQNASARRFFPQPCLSAGRRFAASRSRLNCYRTIGSFSHEMLCKLDPIEFVRSFPRRTKPNPALTVVGCNTAYDEIGGFHENLATFKYPQLPVFFWAQKQASKNAILWCNKKSGKSGYFYTKRKVAEKHQRCSRHRTKIGPNCNVLAYFRTWWTGTNMHI